MEDKSQNVLRASLLISNKALLLEVQVLALLGCVITRTCKTWQLH